MKAQAFFAIQGDIAMIKKTLLATLFAASLGAVAAPAAAAVYVTVAPPAPRYEVAPQPRRGYTWVPGYWDWRGNRHIWVSGHWVRERHGYHYSQSRWVERDGRWYMERGAWRRGDRDRDGIANYQDRDRDGDGVRNRDDRAPDNPRRY
jgi:hypothetical protein